MEDALRKEATESFPSKNEELFTSSLATLIKETALNERATLVLGAMPSATLQIDAIFDSSSSTAIAFDNAPKIRPDGFGFYIGDPATIVHGKARRKAINGYKVCQLSLSGALTVLVPADEDVLAWFQNRKPGQPIQYRAFILAEITRCFAEYVRSIYDSLSSKSTALDLFIGLRNCFVDGVAPLLGIARDDGFYHYHFEPPKPAPSANFLLTSRQPFDITADRIAFELRALLYRAFGFGDEKIPYTSPGADGRVSRVEDILLPRTG